MAVAKRKPKAKPTATATALNLDDVLNQATARANSFPAKRRQPMKCRSTLPLNEHLRLSSTKSLLLMGD